VVLSAEADRYVSRAGLKLAHALDHFGFDPAGCCCLDIGASTGGFTQVLLERGAAKVFAVDVGHGQLAAALAADPRVVDLEGTDARRIDGTLVPATPDFIVADVSFIGLEKALPAALALAAPAARLVVLVKPQFEAGPNDVGKDGVVRNEAVRDAAVRRIAGWLEGAGWSVDDRVPSPVPGKTGNIEWLIAARRDARR
jgi:23S rRNA (cytidine1920-2'-O)/16S rRNA (cytidine1409-2'-O)-methyltransferase